MLVSDAIKILQAVARVQATEQYLTAVQRLHDADVSLLEIAQLKADHSAQMLETAQALQAQAAKDLRDVCSA